MHSTLALGVLALYGSLMALGAAYAFDRDTIVGHEKKPHADTNLVSPSLPKAAQQQFLEKLNRIRDSVVATPALRELRGYDWATFNTLKNDYREAFPLVGRVGYIAYPYADIHGEVASSAEGPPFTVHVNDPDVVLGQSGYNIDKQAGFTIAPRIVSELDGYPVYEEQFVALTRDRRPLFVPVSEERYLQSVIEKARRDLADMRRRFASAPESPSVQRGEIESRLEAIRNARAENERRWAQMQPKWPDRVAAERARYDEKERGQLAEVEELKTTTPRQRFLKPFEQRLAAMEAELAGLSAAERAAPARLAEGKPTRASGLAVAGANSRRAISMLNPQVFDRSKPKHAIQLIILGTTRYLPDVYQQVQRQVDKAALVALME